MKWRNLIAACAAITVFGFALGMTYPLLSLLLEAQGVSSTLMGLNAAMMPLGILLFSPFIPKLSRRFGAPKSALFAAITTAIILLLYKVFDSLTAWFIIRLLQGMAESILFVLSEAWILQYAGDAHRGKIVALYGAVLAASFAAGPALLSWVGIEGWAPFAIGAATVLLSLIPLSMIREEASIDEEENMASGLFTFALKAPVLLSAVAVFAIFDAATLSFIPIYALRIGFDLSTAALALTTLIIGNVILQFPIGWLADHYSKRKLLGLLCFITIIFSLLLSLVGNSIWIWLVLAVLGASGYGVYTVAMAELGGRFSGHELVTGSSAFAVMWGLGALFGSIAGGGSMSLLGAAGLPILLATSYTVLLAGMLLRNTLKSAPAG